MFYKTNNPNRHYDTPSRVVKNTRWIHRNELKLGMYIRELDIPWEETRFMFQGFEVDNYTLLREVQAVAEYVCVESQKVARISVTGSNRMCASGTLR